MLLLLLLVGGSTARAVRSLSEPWSRYRRGSCCCQGSHSLHVDGGLEVDVGDVGVHVREGRQLRVVGHEEGVGVRHGQSLGDGEGERDSVDVGRAAAQLVDDDQGTRGEVLQDVGAGGEGEAGADENRL